MLTVTNLHAHYGKSHVLQGVNLTVNSGEAVAVLGRNGVGKTTTLKSIMGLLRPTGGGVQFNGIALEKLPPFKVPAQRIGYVPQGRHIFPTLTVFENLCLGLPKDPPDEALEPIFAQFPLLKERLKQLGGTLSGGEQQMLAIARCLVIKPKLLLLDEPTEGIMPNSSPNYGKKSGALINPVCRSCWSSKMCRLRWRSQAAFTSWRKAASATRPNPNNLRPTRKKRTASWGSTLIGAREEKGRSLWERDVASSRASSPEASWAQGFSLTLTHDLLASRPASRSASVTNAISPVDLIVGLLARQSRQGRHQLSSIRTTGIAGRPVEYIVEDTETNPPTGARKFRSLVQRSNCDFVIGSVHWRVDLATVPIAKELQTIYIPQGMAAEMTGKGNRLRLPRRQRHLFTGSRRGSNGPTRTWARIGPSSLPITAGVGATIKSTRRCSINLVPRFTTLLPCRSTLRTC